MTEEELIKQYAKNCGDAIDRLEDLAERIDYGDPINIYEIEDIIKTLNNFEVV